MKASVAITLLVYVCMGVAMQATVGSLACGPCEEKSPPKKKIPPKKKSPPKPPSPTPKPPSPTPKPPSPPSSSSTCSIDYKKLGTCTPLLGGILGIGSQCCGLLGLLDLDVVVCLCLAVDANVLGIIDIKVSKLDVIATILTSCNRTVPKNLACPS